MVKQEKKWENNCSDLQINQSQFVEMRKTRLPFIKEENRFQTDQYRLKKRIKVFEEYTISGIKAKENKETRIENRKKQILDSLKSSFDKNVNQFYPKSKPLSIFLNSILAENKIEMIKPMKIFNESFQRKLGALSQVN